MVTSRKQQRDAYLNSYVPSQDRKTPISVTPSPSVVTKTVTNQTFNEDFPGLNEKNYRKMETEIDKLRLSSEKRQEAMNNRYRSNIPTILNDQTLDERDTYLNQQAYQAAKIQDPQAYAQLRMTQASQKAKREWNLDATANDLDIFTDIVNSLPNGMQLAGEYLEGKNTDLLLKAGLEKAPEEELNENFWGELWNNVKTKSNVPVDNMKKWGYRTFNALSEKVYRDIIKKTVGDSVIGDMGINLDDYIDVITDNTVTPALREDTLNYQNEINQRYSEKEQKNLNQNIKNYYDNKGYTELLTDGDFKGFAYKTVGDAAQNWEMPVVIAASVVQPEVGLALMATDTYARENQEAFENMLNNGASYDEAEQGAVVVGLINSAVEICLEKLIGGVETGASDAIRKTFMKNVTEEATKKGLGRILLEGAGMQLKASAEEGLEEIVQQIVQNAAVKTINENQDLFEGVGQAFEGGFYNPMNLLAGGGNLTQNISQNKDVIGQQITDGKNSVVNATNSVVNSLGTAKSFMNNKITSLRESAKEWMDKKKNGKSVEEVTETTNATTPQGEIATVDNELVETDNGAIELIDEETTTQDTNLTNQKGGSKFWEAVSGLEDNIKEKIKRNPYAIEESKELINNMENNPGLDFTEYQNERYESVLDMIEERLKQAENKRKNDVGSLYTKLEEANAPIDTTNLQSKISEYQARVEELGDILSSSDKAKIETILKNIQEIGDGTMDIWKVRKIADQWAKYDQGATGDGIRLIRDIRNAIDDEIMAQNPEMKEVDQAYRKAKDEIQDLRGNLVYKKTGEIKSNAVSTVKNMLNANNKKYLNTLEKYLPGITDRLQAIRDSKLVYNAYTSGEGSRFVSKGRDFVTKGILAGGGYLLGGPVMAAAGYLVSGQVDKALTNLARKGLKETITNETAESRAELERINKKIEENQRLEEEEKAKLKALGEKIMANVATVEKTDAEQSAWESYLADLEQDEVVAMPEEVYDQWDEIVNKPVEKKSNKKTTKKWERNKLTLK